MLRRALVILSLTAVSCGMPMAIDDGGEDASVTTDGSVLFDGGHDAGTMNGTDASVDAGGVDAGPSDGGSVDSGTDAGVFDAGGLELVSVSAPRELRGVWVATVVNLDFPTAQGLSADAGRAQLANLVDSMADAGLNALFFQVRPESDALYPSTLEPWSRFLTGTQGRDPGWDPLDELLTMAHAKGLEVHAWVNPYRALQSASVTAASNHVSRTLSQYAITYNGQVVMNPGAPAVRQHVEAVMQDLLTRYDVDGLHFDDYFYPYPDSMQTPFPDSATYSAYQADGGTMSLGDWRRDNVNTLVREVMSLVVNDHPQVRFGISPFGIWRSNQPVPGLDAYSAISCDAPTWLANGWVDYLAPQLYWRIGSPQDYTTLATWWAMRVGDRHLFPGHADHLLAPPPPPSTSTGWPLQELEDQINVTRTLKAQGALGDIHFREAFIANNTKGVAGLFKNTLYAKPAVPPRLPRAGATVAPAVPFLNLVGGTALWVTSPQPQATRFFALYKEVSPGQYELQKVKGGAMVDFVVSSGTWAVSALARGGAESQGVKIVVP